MTDIKNEFENSIVVVTGGSRGIGKTICKEFAYRGANIIYSYIKNHKEAKKPYEELKSFGITVKKVCNDVSKHDEVQKFFSEIIDTYDHIDILVNNAGINVDKTLKKMSIKDWEDVINTNLTGCFNCSKAVLENMIKNNYGRIINISSVIALKGNFGQSNYSASKAGIIGFTKSMALETAKYDITVNAICPGFVETDMIKTIPKDILENIIKNIPKKRIGSTIDIANGVLFLASPNSSYITGQILNINGGYYL